MNEWLLTHSGFAHLFKPSKGEERLAVCSRLMTIYPEKVETWTLKCSKCEMFDKRKSGESRG